MAVRAVPSPVSELPLEWALKEPLFGSEWGQVSVNGPAEPWPPPLCSHAGTTPAASLHAPHRQDPGCPSLRAPTKAGRMTRLQGWRADEIAVCGTKYSDSLQAGGPCCSNSALPAPSEGVPAAVTLASLPGDGALTGDTRSCPPWASCVSGACLGSEAAGPTDRSLALTELTSWGGNVVMCKEEGTLRAVGTQVGVGMRGTQSRGDF